MKSPIFGPYEVSRSTNLAADRLVNLYPEVVETKQGKEIGALYYCPGLDLLASLGDGPIRATYKFLGLLFVVSGSQLYQVNQNFAGALMRAAATATVDTPQTGTSSYKINDVLTEVITGGAGTAPTWTVTNIQVMPTIVLEAAGAGGTPGLTTFTGTTGTGTKFQFTGTIDGGGSLDSSGLTLTVAGNYATDPTDVNAEPVTGGGLVGGKVTIRMGVLQVVLAKDGPLTILPANPVATSGGSGGGATLNVTYYDIAIADGAVEMVDNGVQLLIVAGGSAYVYSAAAGFVTVVLPFTSSGGTITVAQQDGYALINQPGSYEFFQSGLLDFATWDALAFASASGDPDNIVAVAQLDREIWIIKEWESEVWYNAGTPGFAFARIDGVYAETGCVAPRSIARVGDSLCWLAQNKAGQGIVVRTAGHRPERISTFAIEAAILGYAGITDAVGYCYQQGGHEFYVLNFPSGDATWVFDATVSHLTKTPVWHQRASFANGLLHRHWADNHTDFAGKNVVGDYRNGNLYAFNLNTLTDNGTVRKWLRSWRALPQPNLTPTRFEALTIDMQTGIGVVTENPLVMLRWSDDGAHTWSNEIAIPAGKVGETAVRVIAHRLGSTRRYTGLDRIFELSSTDQFPVAIIGAEIDIAA